MTEIKKLLFKIVGLKNYLRILHKSFHTLYGFGYLKNNPIYKYHYFDKNIIKKGDCIIDIGANLGYYTVLFSKWVGDNGKVYAVEPVKYFADTIKWATKNSNNIEVYNYALGQEEKDVTLATPDNFGYLRTGLPHVIDEKEINTAHEFTFKAQMKNPGILFKNIPKLDYIKCDIEGYEDIVLPELSELLIKFKPIIQVESCGEPRVKIEALLKDMGYEIYSLDKNILKPIVVLNGNEFGDLIFINKENNSVLDRLKKDGLA